MQGAPGGPSGQADGWHCCLRRDIGKRLEVRKTVSACLGEPSHITRLEHAQARLTLSYNRRGDLAIHLVSPMGTRSTLLAARCLPCPLPSPSPWPRAFIHPLTQPEGQQTLSVGTLGILGRVILSCGSPILQESLIPPTKCHICVPSHAQCPCIFPKSSG